jgi:hypothetical protein
MSNLPFLNASWNNVEESPDGRKKSGRRQLFDNAMQIIDTSVLFGDIDAFIILGSSCCMNSTQSLDGRGRPQKDIRVGDQKLRVRPWHLTYLLYNGSLPLAPGLQYSHRCHNELCVNDSHGVWETDIQNKNRNMCQSASHVIIKPLKMLITLCKHEPCCLVPIVIRSLDDPRIKNINL